MFELSKYGVDKVLKVNNDKLAGFCKAMLMLSNSTKKALVILLSSTTDSIYLSSLVAVALEVFASQMLWIAIKHSPFK
jgi:electron transfer flavoprotein alpha subunit